MKKSSTLSISLKVPKPFEQLTIEQLYSDRLQEKDCLQGTDLEKAAHLLLDRYLLNKIGTQKTPGDQTRRCTTCDSRTESIARSFYALR